MSRGSQVVPVERARHPGRSVHHHRQESAATSPTCDSPTELYRLSSRSTWISRLTNVQPSVRDHRSAARDTRSVTSVERARRLYCASCRDTSSEQRADDQGNALSAAGREYRSCRDDPERAGRAASGPGARRAVLAAGGRCGRDHRAFAGRPAPHRPTKISFAWSTEIDLPLNLEMAATDEMLEIALRHCPPCGLHRAGKAASRANDGRRPQCSSPGHNHLAPVRSTRCTRRRNPRPRCLSSRNGRSSSTLPRSARCAGY